MSKTIDKDIAISIPFQTEYKVRNWKQQAWYVPSLALAMGIMMLRPLLMARLLDVHEFAFYGLGLLVSSTFCMLGCMGLQSLLQREMPRQFMHKRELAASILLMQCLIVASVCAVFGLMLSLMGQEIVGIDSWMLAVAVLHGLGQQTFLLATVESRSRGQPLRFSQQQLLRATLVLASGAMMAISLDSAMPVLLVEAVVSLCLSWRILSAIWRRHVIGFFAICQLAIARLGHIPWRSAAALFAVMVVSFSLLNVDRWLAASLLPSVLFAQYAFAWVVFLVAQSVQAIVNTSVFPFLARHFAKNGSRACFGVSARISLVVLIVAAVLAWPVLLIIDASIVQLYPDYKEAMSLLYFFVWIAVLRVSDFWSSYLIVAGRENRLLLVNLFVVLLVSTIWFIVFEPWLPGNLQPVNLAALVVMLTVTNYVAVFVTAFISRR